ncbi:MAG: hypothetical protein M3040_15095 [Bacteroidota bacterium]|nr:hypothetical protein [Bacteroidota bacterium]
MPDSNQSTWIECHDEEYGFSLRYPPEWRSVSPAGHCTKLESSENRPPNEIPKVDIFIEVNSLQGKFPSDYLNSKSVPGPTVKYSDRNEIEINGLPAVRAKFTSLGGPVPNWGVEHSFLKGEKVMKIYISQPTAQIEQQYEEMLRTLTW